MEFSVQEQKEVICGAKCSCKKEEKVNKIFSEPGVDCTFEEFSHKFKEEYPDDWERINKVYKQHEVRDKKGKGRPMPEPSQYMKNMYNVGKAKQKK